MYRIARRLTMIVLLTAIMGCDGGSIFTTSDVPVYEPEAWWSDPTPTFWMRGGMTNAGGGGLVLAHHRLGPEGRGPPPPPAGNDEHTRRLLGRVGCGRRVPGGLGVGPAVCGTGFPAGRATGYGGGRVE